MRFDRLAFITAELSIVALTAFILITHFRQHDWAGAIFVAEIVLVIGTVINYLRAGGSVRRRR